MDYLQKKVKGRLQYQYVQSTDVLKIPQLVAEASKCNIRKGYSLKQVMGTRSRI
jgi:hypothetical protein